MTSRRIRVEGGDPGLFVLGMMVGAGLMYYLDPDRGRRRRALLRDRLIHRAHEAEDLGEAAASSARHLRNRARGIMAETRSRFHDARVEDAVLEGRLRAELGRLVHPVGDIRAEVMDGVVRLTGTVNPEDEERIVTGLRKVPGVKSLHNQLRHRTEALR
ncbi:MAG TPA: BON domain-containing protein [Longimicrobiaceae bacterium]